MKTHTASTLILLMALLGGLFATLPARGADPEAFVGEWCNKDFNTRGNTRIRILLDGGKFLVQMWGRCHPVECEWGVTPAAFSPDDKNTLLLTWNQGFAVSTQKLTLKEDGSLKLSGIRTFTDKKRPIMSEAGVFAKGLLHNWSDAKSPLKK